MGFKANFREAKAHTGKGFSDTPTGYYKAVTTEKVPGDGRTTSILMQLVLAEAADPKIGASIAGREQRAMLGLDSSKDGNKNSWFTAWQSHGFDVASLTANEEAEIDEADFCGNECYVLHRAADPNVPGSKGRTIYVTPQAYADEVERFAKGGGPRTDFNDDAGGASAAPATSAKVSPVKASPVKAVPATNGANPPAPPAPAGNLKALLAAKKNQPSA